MALEKRRILFVGGISSMMSEDLIQTHFELFGVVTKVRIMKEKKTKEPKGFAYVTMKDCRVISQILAKQHSIADRKVDIQLASRKGEKQLWKDEQRKRRVFVSNLPIDMSSNRLSELLCRFGEIRNAYIICDFESKTSKGYGYVEYIDPASANRAIRADQDIQGDPLRIQCLPYMGRHENKQASSKEENDNSVSADAGPQDGNLELQQHYLQVPNSKASKTEYSFGHSSASNAYNSKSKPSKESYNLCLPTSSQSALLEHLLPLPKGEPSRWTSTPIAPLAHDQSNIRFNIGCEPSWIFRIGLVAVRTLPSKLQVRHH